jgi:hypothetical protein
MAMTSGPSRSCLARNDVKTPMIYTHVLNRGEKGARSLIAGSTSVSSGTVRRAGKVSITVPMDQSCNQEVGKTEFLSEADKRRTGHPDRVCAEQIAALCGAERPRRRL